MRSEKFADKIPVSGGSLARDEQGKAAGAAGTGQKPWGWFFSLCAGFHFSDPIFLTPKLPSEMSEIWGQKNFGFPIQRVGAGRYKTLIERMRKELRETLGATGN
jgi:hypothetical protein